MNDSNSVSFTFNTPPQVGCSPGEFMKCFAFELGSAFVSTYVGSHFFCRTVDQVNRTILNNEPNEMVLYVDMLHSSMIQAIFHHCNC